MARSVMDIFLSSTSKDLGACRAKVREMIDRMRQVSVAMETFGANPKLPFDTCRETVQRSDALIVLVGHRYGWLPPPEQGGDGRRSITWWEVQWALDGKKPVFAFVLDPSAPWAGEREQDRLLAATTRAEVLEVGRAVDGLREFRRFLDEHTTRELFSSADDLAAKVATSLHPWILEHALRAAGVATPPSAGATISLGGPNAGLQTREGASANVSTLYYAYEQIHAQSALALAPRASSPRIGLISGRADASHPALSGARLQQVNVSGEEGGAEPDGYTTAVAGLLVGSDEARGYRGVTPDAELLVLGILDKRYMAGEGSMIRALEAALIEGVDILCLPLGVAGGSTGLHIAIKTVVNAGIPVICPAGNQPARVAYPAAFPETIGLAAVTSNGTVADFSGYGQPVALAAPGQDIAVPIDHGAYRNWAGTAFSCAIGTGVVALIRRVAPRLSPARIKEVLCATATRLAPPFEPNGGLVNAFLAVQEAMRQHETPEPARRESARSRNAGRSRSGKKRPVRAMR